MLLMLNRARYLLSAPGIAATASGSKVYVVGNNDAFEIILPTQVPSLNLIGMALLSGLLGVASWRRLRTQPDPANLL